MFSLPHLPLTQLVTESEAVPPESSSPQSPLPPSVAAWGKSLSFLARMTPATSHKDTQPAHLPPQWPGPLDKVPRPFLIKPNFRTGVSSLAPRYLPALTTLHTHLLPPCTLCVALHPLLTCSFCLDRPLFLQVNVY